VQDANLTSISVHIWGVNLGWAIFGSVPQLL
jgi:hypothetical protein